MTIRQCARRQVSVQAKCFYEIWQDFIFDRLKILCTIQVNDAFVSIKTPSYPDYLEIKIELLKHDKFKGKAFIHCQDNKKKIDNERKIVHNP